MRYVVTMDSCQRGQSIEPSAVKHQASPNISGNDLSFQVSVNDTSSSLSKCEHLKPNESVQCLIECHGIKQKRKHRKCIWGVQWYD